MDGVEPHGFDSADVATLFDSAQRHRFEFAAGLCVAQRVLHLGCGNGYGSAILAARARSVLGVDTSEARIHAAATLEDHLPVTHFEHCDVDEMLGRSLRDAVDVIVCFDLLTGAPDPELRLRLLRSHARDGVKIITNTSPPDATRQFDGFPGLIVLPQYLAEGSLISPPGAQTAEVAIVLEDRDEPEYAHDLLVFSGFEARDLQAMHHGAVQVSASPQWKRRVDGVTEALEALDAENARLARAEFSRQGGPRRPDAGREDMLDARAELPGHAAVPEDLPLPRHLMARSAGARRPIGTLSGDDLKVGRGDLVVGVPLHGAHRLFVRCLGSVLEHTPLSTPIVVLDDHTPDARSQAWFEELSASGQVRHRVTWLRRPERGGFVASCNDLFDLCEPADVVIVNSDVVVAAEWCERMLAARDSDSTTATVTTLTNHGSIVSVPARNTPRRDLPPGMSVDEAALRVGRPDPPHHPRLAVTVGHCMLVTRRALDLVGGFDVEFSPGYGEEVDFSQRALAMGLQHVVADDVFVEHHGGGSFGQGASEIQQTHEVLLDRRYPYYRDLVTDVAGEPHGPLARAVGRARVAIEGLTVTLDGRCLDSYFSGTQRHTLELVGALARQKDVRVRLLLPDGPGEYVAPALARMSGVEALSESDAMHATRDSVVHRPWQIGRPADIETLTGLGEHLVITQQDMIAYRNPTYFASGTDWRWYRTLAIEALGLSSMVLFFSDHARRDALSEGLVEESRARAIPLGVDHEAIANERSVPPDGFASHTPFLFCLGANFRHKNRVFALRVLRALQEEHGWDGRLVFTGPAVRWGSSETDERLYRTAHDLDDVVVDLGMLGEAQKQWMLEHCAAVVYPTTYEGFGLVPFEAARAGRPCAFASQSALGDLFDERQALVVPWDARATAANVIKVIEDPDARDAHLAALRDRAEALTWDSTARAVLAAYREAVERPVPAGARVWRATRIGARDGWR